MKLVALVLLFMCGSVWASGRNVHRVIEETIISTPFPPTQSYIYMKNCEYKHADNSSFWTKVTACCICSFVLYWWWSAADAEDEPFMNFVFET